jgi:hypothetical protein
MSPSYIIWDVLSSLLLGACGLALQRQVKSVIIMAHIPGAVVKQLNG